MIAKSGEVETKKMTLQQLRFSKINPQSEHPLNSILVSPNPMKSSSTFRFSSQLNETVEVFIYNQLGSLVKTITHEATLGKNEIKLNRGTLSSGLYICKVQSETTLYKITKLILE